MLNNIHKLDTHAFLWCKEHSHATCLEQFARRTSWSADGYLYLLIPLILVLLDDAQGLQFTMALLLAFSIERPLYLVMKNGIKRRRPPEALPGIQSLVVASDKFSFPSGHTSGAFLFATLYCLFYAEAIPVLWYTWAGCVALSRVLLGVHFPSDVVMGALLGSGSAWLALELLGL